MTTLTAPNTTVATSEPKELNARHFLGMGATIGVIASLVGVGGALWLSGTQAMSAIALGLFVAFWGGLGFGCMIGGVIWATKVENSTH